VDLTKDDPDRWLDCYAAHVSLRFTGTVPLRKPAKSSRTGAIFWLLSSPGNHEILRRRACFDGSDRSPDFSILRRLCAGTFGPGSPAAKSLNNFTGSASSALAMAINSTRSIRRSPPSYFAMNDWGFPSFSASFCCRTPAACRTATSISTSRAYSGDLRDFCMRRQSRESTKGNLIPKSDYPKTGYCLSYELSCASHNPGDSVK
jgi:hypothetical protein